MSKNFLIYKSLVFSISKIFFQIGDDSATNTKTHVLFLIYVSSNPKTSWPKIIQVFFYNNGYVVPIIYIINKFITREPPIASLTLNWLIYWGNYHNMIHNKSFNCLFRKKVRHIIKVSNSLWYGKYVIKVNLNIEQSTPTSTESARKGHRYFVISSMLKLNYIVNIRPGEQDGPYTSLFSYLLINIAVRVFWLLFLSVITFLSPILASTNITLDPIFIYPPLQTTKTCESHCSPGDKNWRLNYVCCLVSETRRYMAEILPIRRKTLSNQLINHVITFN